MNRTILIQTTLISPDWLPTYTLSTGLQNTTLWLYIFINSFLYNSYNEKTKYDTNKDVKWSLSTFVKWTKYYSL